MEVKTHEYDGGELKQAVEDMREMIELGVKYSQEKGLEPNYLKKRKQL